MSIKKELQEQVQAIKDSYFEQTNPVPTPDDCDAFDLGVDRALDALLPIIAKYAVSLVEVDEKKVENILRDKLAEYDGNMETIPKDWEEKTARTLATSNIIKPKE